MNGVANIVKQTGLRRIAGGRRPLRIRGGRVSVGLKTDSRIQRQSQHEIDQIERQAKNR